MSELEIQAIKQAITELESFQLITVSGFEIREMTPEQVLKHVSDASFTAHKEKAKISSALNWLKAVIKTSK